ncbi:hypothetical protein CHLNCDRAFT_57209 [Chlorella variabilis]|uniref:NFACT RNA-binding domain-containing protein n=1 Tax=Chlorella variabilis TaxID=554065 RepID=E1Z8V2_CHLVA|nr:hypothetical protein CHLNCDRAFT_57209 [Chlorella variabilis]EFN57403.1 hypothetical protein CHLNCDRAFT_57209 [Chlorella variabilis]|eukprot:XP_005849505.1 hypothetical protein CHLNCDRAFT_57209 [Chlorella variabilis]
MVKQRFSSADVAAEVSCLQRCLGMRVANVYDINPKTYVLKLARSGEDGEKVLLLIESGVRFHTVQAMPEKADTPSNFTLKLRKHIRTRRLEAVKQLGVDRIVQLSFGSGPASCHLLLEFYAQASGRRQGELCFGTCMHPCAGNVILADDKFEVLTLLRSHRDDAKGVAIMARHPYPIQTIRLRQPLSAEALEAALAGAAPEATLKGCLADLVPYGPLTAEHCVLLAGLEPQRQPAAAPLSALEAAALLGGVRQWEAWLDACEDSATPPEGFILTKPAAAAAAAAVAAVAAAPPAPAAGQEDGGDGGAPAAAGVYDEFQPLLLIQGQRSAHQQAAKEKAAVGKLEAIRRDHEKRLGSLGQEAEAAELKAALIEYNLEAVDAALNAVREALASGMDWRDLARMVKEERRAGNPVAGLIDSLQLERSRVTLLLRRARVCAWGGGGVAGGVRGGNWLDEEDGDEEAATRPATKVEVDLGLSAHANARTYYDSRRKHQARGAGVKQQKTLDANQKALKAAEKKAQQQLKQVRSAAAAPAITRKPFWFEKFFWFISSENYLVLSGRDAQQNELLVKRYLRRGDAYVHADLHGASSTIVRNSDPGAPIPPLTLSQAGQACVCRSQAWDAKIVTSAWWVHPEQVSKTAPSGEYLPLVMGYGYMFGLAEESIPAHMGERAPRLRPDDASAAGAAEEKEAGSSGGEDGEEEEGEEEEQPGGSAGAAAPSALEAFLDASADSLAGGGAAGSAPSVRRGSSTGSGTAAAAATDAMAASFERYGLSDTLAAGGAAAAAAAGEEAQEGGEGAGAAAGGEGSRRHLSAKERQLLKKQQQGKPAQPPQPPQAGGGAGKKAAAQQDKGSGAGQQAAAESAAAKARGGSGGGGGKGKRGGRDKYADQDEQDRQLAMQLLQSAGQKKDRKQRKDERKQREITAEDIAKLTARPEAAAGSGGEEEGEEEEHEEGGEQSDAAAGSGSGEGAQEERRQEEEEGGAGDGAAREPGPAAPAGGGEGGGEDEAAAEGSADDAAAAAEAGGGDDAAEVAALLKEEKLEALGEEERDKLTQLDQLTGVPRGEDILLFAVPVCAPYQVLASFKFKVKIIPGTLKKGKAARQAAELLLKGGEASQRERDLLRAVPEQEAISCLCGKGVRIQSAGLLKLKQAQKKSRK